MKQTSITIVTYSSPRRMQIIELKHNDEVVLEAQEYSPKGFKLPLKGILKAFYKLIKLKIKRRGWKIK